LNVTSAIGILINIGLNLFLIPEFGATGAAFASFLTQSFIALVQIVYCLKIFKLTISIKTLIKYLMFVLLIVSVSFWQEANEYLILYQILLGISLMFALSFVDLKNLKELFLKNPSFK
jgi:O-antigen/teichoic acid export membrane protein